MNSYFIAQIKIKDKAIYQKYLNGFDEIFSGYEGEVIMVDDNPIVLEGSWDYTRMVIIRFPGEDEAKRWYDSEEYQKLVQYRLQAADADVLLAKGRK